MSRGRPRIEIDEENFKKLCGLQCTLSEIASFFDCSEDTIENWCKRTLLLRHGTYGCFIRLEMRTSKSMAQLQGGDGCGITGAQ